MKKYLLGIDNGGTFSKAALFDLDGNQIGVSSKQTEIITPKSGYTERDMNLLWEANYKSIKEVIENSGVDPKDIMGVSISGHGKGLYMIGEDDNPIIYNGIVSTDTRAWEYVEKWNQDGTSDKVFKKTFQSIMACQPVALLAWFKDNKPEVLEKVKWIFSVKDYVRYMLTGEAYAEYTDFSGGNLVNMITKEYDEELLSYFGIEDLRDKLPKLKYSAEICGHITKEAALKTGLLEGTPVAGGMFDIDACGIATGMVDEEQLCMIAGTWSINEYISKTPVTDKSVALNSMFCMPGYYLIEESSPTSAGNLEWVIQNMLDGYLKESEKENVSIYDVINKKVGSIEPKDSDVIFLPFLNGSNEDALGRGTFIGMTSYHTKAHLARAVYEGVVFSHMSHLNKLFKNREKPNRIRISGGAANSNEWVQIFADVIQIPIEVVEDKELGAQGAAMAAGIAVGAYESYKEAAERTVKISKTVYPRSEYKEIYERKYRAYRKVVDSLKDTWKHLAIEN